MKLRIAGLVPESIVDGPGVRFTVFVQGCYRSCPGCHNPDTQDPAGGREVTIEEVLMMIRQGTSYLSGVTFSGGEPFEQAATLALLADEVKAMGLHIVVYSGYRWEELQLREDAMMLLRRCDWLIDGPYREEERDLAIAFRGSRNQRIVDVASSLRQGRVVTVQGYV
ncbi:anaerobic ribonucleoside-triphosphate reductase activating protein [Heliophilum fasciatum]|uniref:Anaerobic ribonucleoside-triphosphate reductase-activating protein n=1 Tax=Heliophilum fasciatum TaxID=35700 RepID=A0A4R2RI37_9FIRM|nr:anaerobic ribonucleoside-triphosphate reductase activating protein [Heliophilum fasciatum]MCW2278869.1 anaerobic ribonucleoside-triphosphate reductase activating protein [Heliophilum fasciatum]TCP62119.1 anaerobic ribonucleoside-triphosphate reductase activating protein [Heliophilum fasciatum]